MKICLDLEFRRLNKQASGLGVALSHQQKALSLNFFTSSSILVGSVGGFFFLELFEYLESPLLGFAAGALLVVVLTDLIPHSIGGSYERLHYVKHILLFLIGVALMLAVSVFITH